MTLSQYIISEYMTVWQYIITKHMTVSTVYHNQFARQGTGMDEQWVGDDLRRFYQNLPPGLPRPHTLSLSTHTRSLSLPVCPPASVERETISQV